VDSKSIERGAGTTWFIVRPPSSVPLGTSDRRTRPAIVDRGRRRLLLTLGGGIG
jgi:hypothetical protein